MPGLLRYYGSMLARAIRDTGRFANRQGIGVGLLITVLGGLLGGFRAAEFGDRFNAAVAVESAIIAALLVLAIYFLASLVFAPHRMAEDQKATAAADERECTDRVNQLSGELAAAREQIDERAKRRATREQLGKFLIEGERLQERTVQEPAPPTQDVQAWLNRIYVFLPDALDDSYLARFQSTAGIHPMSRVKNGTIIPAGLEELVRMRCVRLKEFLAELSSKP